MKTRTMIVPALLLVLASCAGTSRQPDPALGYRASFPGGFQPRISEGLYEPILGQIAEGPRNAAGTLSATISVFGAPDVVHGGLWQDENTQADHELWVLGRPRPDGFDNGFQLLADRAMTLDGAPARSLAFDLDLWLAHFPLSQLPIRARERVVYAKKGTRVVRISLLADRADFAGHAAAFDTFLSTFAFE